MGNHFTDQETSVDLFHLDSYIKGLSQFILNCQCPMTIAIQGSWGSGKSSMMKMVEEQIKKDAVCITFNTWQYSQFNLGDDLPLIFYQSLIEKMAANTPDKAAAENIKECAMTILTSTVRFASKQLCGGIFEDTVEHVLDNDRKNPKTAVQSIEALKNGFREMAEKRCQIEEKKRMVFFVDDLDRLPPQRAVELMEILKIILECERCIFVLAIDYDVVSRGVKAKYGDDIGESKGRSFFDKIIQVPFSLPVGKYDIKSYIETLLKDGGGRMKMLKDMQTRDGHIRNELVELVRYSIGCNPRSIKRLINTFTLLMYIEEGNRENSGESLLFPSLCMQLAYESVYNYLLDICGNYSQVNEFFGWFDSVETLDGVGGAPKEKMRLDDYTDVEKDQLLLFIEKFITLLNESSKDEDTDMNISEEAFERLKNALKTASVTVTKAPVSEEGSGGGFDTKITDIHETLKLVLKEKSEGREVTQKVISAAMKQVAEQQGKQPSCVISECTRGLNKLNSEQFYDLVIQFAHGNSDGLIQRVIEANKNKKITPEMIRGYFEELV